MPSDRCRGIASPIYPCQPSSDIDAVPFKITAAASDRRICHERATQITIQLVALTTQPTWMFGLHSVNPLDSFRNPPWVTSLLTMGIEPTTSLRARARTPWPAAFSVRTYVLFGELPRAQSRERRPPSESSREPPIGSRPPHDHH